MSQSERPRRSARVPAKYQEQPVDETADSALPTASKKRKVVAQKASHDDPNSMEFMLRNSKSPFVSLDLSTLINENTWSALTSDSRALLSTMLPSTVFPFSRPNFHPLHPANKQHAAEENNAVLLDVDAMVFATEPNPSFLTDAFFEAAAKTFQDHLYSGWLTPAHATLVQEYREKTKTREKHAPWKDETWNAEHPVSVRTNLDGEGPAGEASSLTLQDLAKNYVLCVGDVLAYRRVFSQLNITVMKDILIQHISPTTGSLTVVAAPSTQRHLPRTQLLHPDILHDDTELATSHVQEMTIVNPSQLESALLDMDGRIEKAKRPNGNAWKSLGVWRWRDEMMPISAYAEDSEEAARGGREYRGTLFYLRGCFYDDQ